MAISTRVPFALHFKIFMVIPSQQMLKAWCAMNGTAYSTVCKKLENFKVGRGKWNLEVTSETIQDLEELEYYVMKANLYLKKNDAADKFGNFGSVKKIIKSGLFYPTFIAGLSGNGKTLSVQAKRVLSWVVN